MMIALWNMSIDVSSMHFNGYAHIGGDPVLLLCLQLRAFTLGFVLALCVSIGLAITLVAVGVTAALGVPHATQQ